MYDVEQFVLHELCVPLRSFALETLKIICVSYIIYSDVSRPVNSTAYALCNPHGRVTYLTQG